jgi:CHAD domain-containing protein
MSDQVKKKKARLHPATPVAQAWSRAVEQERARALDWLSGTTEASAEHAIHQARRACKRLRALLRLAEPKLGEPVADVRRWVAAAGRALAPSRDAAVCADTLKGLLERYGSALETEATDELAARFAVAAPAELPAQARGDAVATLEALHELLAEADVEQLARGDLVRGAAAAYRQARRRWRKLDAQDVDAWHALRSAAQVHANQLRALRACTDGELRGRERRLAELVALLGEANDRATLRGALEHAAAGTLCEVLCALLRQEEQVLQADAALLAAELFEPRQRAFRRALKQAWTQTLKARMAAAEQAEQANQPPSEAAAQTCEAEPQSVEEDAPQAPAPSEAEAAELADTASFEALTTADERE